MSELQIVRCKMKCTSILERPAGHSIRYHFEAVCADEVPENQRFHKYTLSGSIDLEIDNPNVSYEIGKSYYFDSTPVPA